MLDNIEAYEQWLMTLPDLEGEDYPKDNIYFKGIETE